MLSAKQILQATKRSHPIIIQNAKRVKVQIRAVKADADAFGEFREVVAICKADTIPRQVIARFYGPKGLDAKTWLSCSCEYFLYVCEVALENKNSSDIVYSNGEEPVMTNPRKTPRTCKHCVAVILSGAFTLEPKVTKKAKTKKPEKTEAPKRMGRSKKASGK